MTKRPFAYIGFSMLVSFAAFFYFKELGAYLCFGAAAVFIGVAFFVKSMFKSRIALILISLALIASTAYAWGYSVNVTRECELFDGKRVSVKARVCGEVNSKYGSDIIELESEEIDGEEAKYKIQFYYDGDSKAEYGDSVSFRATLVKCDNDYYLSKGFRFRAENLDYDSVKIEQNENKGAGYIPIYLRTKLCGAVDNLIGGYDGELCKAVTFGDRNSMSTRLYGWFTETGLSFIIVVSGMHMSIIAMFLMIIFSSFSYRKLTRVLSFIGIVSGIILYAAITGCSSSSVRSAVMMIIVVAGGTFLRETDIYNSLGAAAIVLTVLNPYAVGDVGMLLSFASVFGIAFLGGPFISKTELKFQNRITDFNEQLRNKDKKSANIANRLKKSGLNILKYTIELFIVSAAASIAVFPITLLKFGEWYPFVFLYSILFAFTLNALMFFTLIAAIIYYIPILSLTAGFFAFFAKAFAHIDVYAVSFLAKRHFACHYSEPKYSAVYIALVLVFFVIALTRKRRKVALAAATAFSMLAFVAGYALLANYEDSRTYISVLNTGKGITVVLKDRDGTDVVSCGGRMYKLNDTMNKIHFLSHDISTLFISGENRFETSYAEKILDEFDVNRVIMYYNTMRGDSTYALASNNKDFNPVGQNRNMVIHLSGGVNDYVFNADGHTWQYLKSDSVSVLIVPYRGKIAELPEQYRTADVVLMCREIDYFRNEIKYKKLIWLSDEPVPKGLKNCERAGDGVEIEMN